MNTGQVKVCYSDVSVIQLPTVLRSSFRLRPGLFSVFRDDFSPKFVALFTLLLFLKSFHWLAEDRVDFMERSPSISILFHVRVISLAVLLVRDHSVIT